MYEGERKGWFGPPRYQRLVEQLWEKGISGVTVTRAEQGFDRRGKIQDIHSEYLSDNLPVTLECVATANEMDQVIALVREIVTQNLQAWTTDHVMDAKTLNREQTGVTSEGTVDPVADSGLVKVYMKESDMVGGEPLHQVLLEKLSELGVPWVNVYSALEGFGKEQVLRRTHNFSMTNKAPIVLEAVLTRDIDTANVLAALQPYFQKAAGPAVFIPGQSV